MRYPDLYPWDILAKGLLVECPRIASLLVYYFALLRDTET